MDMTAHDDDDDDAARRKSAIRETALTARSALTTKERRHASGAIVDRLRRVPELETCRTVVVFAPLGTEVAIDPWIEERIARGIGVFLPFVDGDGLSIARVRDLSADVARGWRGVREPLAAKRRPARVDRVEAFVVPGAAFDAAGARVGYGGGHFDRLLSHAGGQAHIVGVAFDSQIVPEIPLERHDVRMHQVITDRRRLRCRVADARHDDIIR
jgi:5-formyltetrahydrofolate cyclo-ligase